MTTVTTKTRIPSAQAMQVMLSQLAASLRHENRDDTAVDHVERIQRQLDAKAITRTNAQYRRFLMLAIVTCHYYDDGRLTYGEEYYRFALDDFIEQDGAKEQERHMATLIKLFASYLPQQPESDLLPIFSASPETPVWWKYVIYSWKESRTRRFLIGLGLVRPPVA